MSAATLDLIFTGLLSASLLGVAGVGLLALPWSASDAEASARAFQTLARLPASWLRAQRVRRVAPMPMRAVAGLRPATR